MAVQILNDMPDAAVHRGDRSAVRIQAPPSAVPASPGPLSDWSPRATRADTAKNRPLFIGITIGVHVVALIGFLSVRHVRRVEQPPPLIAEIYEAPQSADDVPPITPPPMQDVMYSLPTPEMVSIELETLAPPPVSNSAVAQTTAPAQAVTPPLVETVEYVRAPAPQYPRESSRRHEYGTVVLRVLVDPSGRATQIQIERTSGFGRLDEAARQAVEKALFRPYEVNGVRQAAQVLIPIEFTRRAT
jgi:periplasmic protein TonB